MKKIFHHFKGMSFAKNCLRPECAFNWKTHAYLLQISIMHNKKQVPLLDMLLSCISARSESEILSIKEEYTVCFSNFLLIALRNSQLIVVYGQRP